ncbi:glycine-rich RNA-binding protein 4, mitochondrial [Trifolium repens]|nr:glycine-rich RNA-binding protein 4, mitochondrial [Trifolium repens]
MYQQNLNCRVCVYVVVFLNLLSLIPFLGRGDVNPRFMGVYIPHFMWHFVNEMIMFDDKTVVVLKLWHVIKDETSLLEHFKPFGEVIRAKIVVIDAESNNFGYIGFVTFVNKEDAHKAIDKFNGSSIAEDNCILKVDLVLTPNKST